MKDLYKRLNVEQSSDEATIRLALQALPADDAATREAAAFVLLDPSRRAVYDRNRRVLVTIGQLRGRLALNSRPFWRRGDFRDFSYTFGPTATRRVGFPRLATLANLRVRPRPRTSIDPIAAALISGRSRPRSRRQTRARLLWIAAVAGGLLVVLAAAVIAQFM